MWQAACWMHSKVVNHETYSLRTFTISKSDIRLPQFLKNIAMWTAATVVIGALGLELVLLLTILLPLPGFIAKPFTGLLKRFFHTYVFGSWVGLVLFLVIDSSLALYGYQTKLPPTDNFALVQFNLMKFRAQSDFYLTGSTFVLLLIILRCRQIISGFSKTKEELDNLQNEPSRRKVE